MLKMEAAGFSKILVPYSNATWNHNQGDLNLNFVTCWCLKLLHPTLNVEDHPLSAVHDCLATPYIWRTISSIHNLRTYNAMETGTHHLTSRRQPSHQNSVYISCLLSSACHSTSLLILVELHKSQAKHVGVFGRYSIQITGKAPFNLTISPGLPQSFQTNVMTALWKRPWLFSSFWIHLLISLATK